MTTTPIVGISPCPVCGKQHLEPCQAVAAQPLPNSQVYQRPRTDSARIAALEFQVAELRSRLDWLGTQGSGPEGGK